MTNKEISENYLENSVKIAEAISSLDEIRNRFEYLSRIKSDNCDPYITLSEALEKLGIALASAVIYYSEYAKDKEE